jgi:copper chaperone CopZ
MLDLKVTGMNCGGCVRTVEKVVGKVPGVEKVTVTLETGHVEVAGSPDPGAVKAAIEKAGYGVSAQ